jgi:molybdate transport system ATP-binding protein
MLDVLIKTKLKDITLDVSFYSEHKRIVIFGPSGAGKSTILKIIAGFMNPKEGYIRVGNIIYFDSEKKINLNINKRKVGYLPQDYVLFPNMNIKQNLFYGSKFINNHEDNYTVELLIDKLQIGELLNNFPQTLSGGQKQRVALARALFAKPSILLLDEPFSALHTSIRDSLRELVINITEEFNLMSILVTHDLDEAFNFGEKIIMIYNGKIIEEGRKEKIFNKPESINTVKLLNIKNFWKVKERKENIISTETGLVFTIDVNKWSNYVAVKPESIMILREDKPINKKYDNNIFSGTITNIKYYEHFVKVEFLEELTTSFFIINLPSYVIAKLDLFE